MTLFNVFQCLSDQWFAANIGQKQLPTSPQFSVVNPACSMLGDRLRAGTIGRGWLQTGGMVTEEMGRWATKKRRAKARRQDGGAGNRTLVRISFQNCVYVRRLDSVPSSRAGNRPTFPRSIS